MLDQSFEVIIHKRPDMLGGIDIYVFERRGKTVSLAKPVEFVLKEVKDDSVMPEPTIRLAGLFAQTFLKAWAEALAKEGIKHEDQSELKGRFEATKYHLEDMRKLVFDKFDKPDDTTVLLKEVIGEK